MRGESQSMSHAPALGSAWLRIATPVITSSVAAVVSGALLPPLAGVPTGLFILSVLASTWFAGVEAGILASLLGGVAFDYFFIAPRFSFEITSPSSLMNLVAF